MSCGNQRTAVQSQFSPSTLLTECLSCSCHSAGPRDPVSLARSARVTCVPWHPAFWVLHILGTKFGYEACAVSQFDPLACLPGHQGIFPHVSLMKSFQRNPVCFQARCHLGPHPVPLKKPTVKFSQTLKDRRRESQSVCPRSHSASKQVPCLPHMDSALATQSEPSCQ